MSIYQPVNYSDRWVELRVRKCMTYPVKITSQHPLGENLKENQAIWKMNVLYTEKKKFPSSVGR